MSPRWMPLWKMFSMWHLFLFLILPTWMPLDAFSVKDSQHWILFVWHIAPEIDDGICSKCQHLVSFVQVLEKTLWNALSFENPFGRAILQAKRSPALWNKGPPEWVRALFSVMKNKLSDAYSKFFSGLLTFSLGSGCTSGSCKIIPKCSLSLEIEH